MSIDYVTGDDHIVTITINRPEARNSLDMEHFYQLRSAWDRFGEDDDAYVAIVTGVGKDFCVGADLKTYIPQITELQSKMKDGARPEELGGYRLDDGVKAVLRGTKLYKPIIAAVNGTCVAGGMEMLGGTDLRVASDTATFAVMEPKRGLFAGGGTTVRLPRQIPYPAAMEFLLCADQVPAQQAYEMGLLNEVCRPADLMARALDYAHRITANGPFAVRKTKESVLRGLATDMGEAYRIETEISGQVFSSEDAKEGPRAFCGEAGTPLEEPLRTAAGTCSSSPQCSRLGHLGAADGDRDGVLVTFEEHQLRDRLQLRAELAVPDALPDHQPAPLGRAQDRCLSDGVQRAAVPLQCRREHADLGLRPVHHARTVLVPILDDRDHMHLAIGSRVPHCGLGHHSARKRHRRLELSRAPADILRLCPRSMTQPAARPAWHASPTPGTSGSWPTRW